MLKRAFATALTAAFLVAATSAMVIVPVNPAVAEMATKEKAKPKDTKEKTGMTGAERRTKCSAEWKEAKAAGKTAGQTWPKFYSACNTRLKAG